MNAEVKFVLITGCSSGIGKTAVHQLRDHGFEVIASCRKLEDVEQLKKEGFEAIQLDLNNSHSIQQAVIQVKKITNEKLYALINNASFAVPGAVEDLSRDALRHQFETNVFGVMELTNAILPMMHQQKRGRIITIGSIVSQITMPYRSAYSASKYALEALHRGLTMELEGSGITVSLIDPGPIATEFRNNAANEFKQCLTQKSSRYSVQYQKLYNDSVGSDKKIMFTLGPEAVVKKILHALTAKHPKRRYYVTVPAYFMAIARRILSTRALDWLMRKSGT